MTLKLSADVLGRINAHGEASYPEEGAGFLLGREQNGVREVLEILPVENAREEEARRNRYLITPQNMLAGEIAAENLGLDILGIFHSHPDHPDEPSEFDRAWALPWYSYVITRVNDGKAAGSRSWRLADDRSGFSHEPIHIGDPPY